MVHTIGDWLAMHGQLTVLLVFFGIFVGFAVWAYAPANKAKLEKYGHIPLEERPEGE